MCVIGSGVVGLTTAVKLLEDCHPDVEVLLDINDLAYMQMVNIHVRKHNVPANDDAGMMTKCKMNLQSLKDPSTGY